ncbi:MAG: F0F1 ATP synthase subunit epsilon [Firmicutes bacterium]|nr:F0F1 ATP synthase subunit epsilon [Bacillota bacterium]MCM1400645.1 F0F1 ATP synthase subunit epsilon [Bacteroides sp.]MCM1476336.1 F0F1 ATP synthase subunit epsilon [Bacteroides sp.]
MTLKIISSEDVVFEGEVTLVTLPGTNGSFTVLNNHASLVSTLTNGEILYKTPSGEELTQPVDGGIVDVDNNVVSVCLY